jgi:hypothetical protein
MSTVTKKTPQPASMDSQISKKPATNSNPNKPQNQSNSNQTATEQQKPVTKAKKLTELASKLKQSTSLSSSMNSKTQQSSNAAKQQDPANKWCINKWLDTHVNNNATYSESNTNSKSRKSRHKKKATRDDNNNEIGKKEPESSFYKITPAQSVNSSLVHEDSSASALSSIITESKADSRDQEEKTETKQPVSATGADAGGGSGQIKVDRRIRDVIGNYLRKNLAEEATRAAAASLRKSKQASFQSQQLSSSTSVPVLNPVAETARFAKLSQFVQLKVRRPEQTTKSTLDMSSECCSFTDSDSTIIEEGECKNSHYSAVVKLSDVLLRETTLKYLHEQVVNNPATWSKSAPKEIRVKRNNLVDSHCHLQMLFYR